MTDDLPDVFFGPVGEPPPDWRKAKDPLNDVDDDEELEKTPSPVVEMLGFDPKELEGEEQSDGPVDN
jgi:hypothetical protein